MTGTLMFHAKTASTWVVWRIWRVRHQTLVWRSSKGIDLPCNRVRAGLQVKTKAGWSGHMRVIRKPEGVSLKLVPEKSIDR